MLTYALGDIQGCDASLAALLERLPFDAERDALWFTGDLVNRGPRSAEALRRIVALSEQLGPRCISVLGNHDIHLLAVAAGLEAPHRGDTLDDLLAAPDRDALLAWLRRQPLLHREVIASSDSSLGATREAAPGSAPGAQRASVEHVLVHAGLHPAWSVDTASRIADEVHAVLSGPGWERALRAITSGTPEPWSDALQGDARLASATALLTRLRTCRADGRSCRHFKGPPADAPRGCTPWYAHPGRASREARIVFGHWASLGLHRADGVLGLDTGCVWGGPLTAVRLEDGALFQQPSLDR